MVASAPVYGRARCKPAERSGLKQASGEVVVRVPHPGQDKEVATSGRADVVDQRLVDEALLGCLELATDILLVAGEQQAHIEIAVDVDAAVIVVAATHDPARCRVPGPGVGQPDMS